VSALEVIKAAETDLDIEPLFYTHYSRIAQIISRVVRDHSRAEELAVDVFWKFCHTPAAQGEHAAGWLYRTAVREGLDELRRVSRRSRFEQFFRSAPEPLNPEQIHSIAEEQSRVRTVLASLEPHQAALLLLRSEGMSYAEISSTTELNPASLGTMIARAQHAFRKAYVKRYGEKRYGH
jgi:RNA polymerase sigma-70 factor (ECF subfamily)